MSNWNITQASELYKLKFVHVAQILADWYQPFGGIAGREILEFGCGEGIMALGIMLQHAPARVVGVEVLDIYKDCLPFAKRNLGLDTLPEKFNLIQIKPGQDLTDLGTFDFIYSWSVFEHVSQNMLESAFRSVANVLKPQGVFMMQISPLFYSAFGSHLATWVPQPWAHLSMQDDVYKDAFFKAPDASPEIDEAWSVYLPQGATRQQKREMIWNVYRTLNRATAPELERLANNAGLQIVRDYRTQNEQPIASYLAEIYAKDVLLTEQVVWLLQRK